MRLYRIEITHLPETVNEYRDGEPYYDPWGEPVTPTLVTKHLADPVLRKQWEDENPDRADVNYDFFWPSETKLYRSRSSARDKVKIVERWGGEARILEAEVGEFIPIQEANQLRKQQRAQERIDKLRAEIDRIRNESGLEVPF